MWEPALYTARDAAYKNYSKLLELDKGRNFVRN